MSVLDDPLLVTSLIAAVAFVVGWAALDGERIAAAYRARRRAKGRGGWIGGSR